MLIVTFNISGMIATAQIANLMSTQLYLGVLLFLGFTAIFFDSLIEEDP